MTHPCMCTQICWSIDFFPKTYWALRPAVIVCHVGTEGADQSTAGIGHRSKPPNPSQASPLLSSFHQSRSSTHRTFNLNNPLRCRRLRYLANPFSRQFLTIMYYKLGRWWHQRYFLSPPWSQSSHLSSRLVLFSLKTWRMCLRRVSWICCHIPPHFPPFPFYIFPPKGFMMRRLLNKLAAETLSIIRAALFLMYLWRNLFPLVWLSPFWLLCQSLVQKWFSMAHISYC